VADVDAADLNGERDVTLFLRLTFSQGCHDPAGSNAIELIFSGVAEYFGTPVDALGVIVIGMRVAYGDDLRRPVIDSEAD
jgi:hypothetical protein